VPDTGSARPVPPREPEPGECCQSGCARCVFDLYGEELERYRVALRDWEEKNGVRPAQ
jgi:hypothetical protein